MSQYGNVQIFKYQSYSNDNLSNSRIDNYSNNENNSLILTELIKQFDFRIPQSVYQNNYPRFLSSNVDQNSKDIYINKHKKRVFSTHFQVNVGKQVYKY